MTRHVHTILPRDVGRPWIRIEDRVWLVSGWIGRILPMDVGKRVYLSGGVLQVENDEQKTARECKARR